MRVKMAAKVNFPYLKYLWINFGPFFDMSELTSSYDKEDLEKVKPHYLGYGQDHKALCINSDPECVRFHIQI